MPGTPNSIRERFAVSSFAILPECPSAFGAGRISGQVADPQGNAVGDVHLKLLTMQRTLVRETASDQLGHFEFPDVGPGQYRVNAEVKRRNPLGEKRKPT